MLKKTLWCAAMVWTLAACGQQGSSSSVGSAASTPAAAPASAPAQQGGLLEKLNNKGTILVGTMGTYAPFTYHDESGNTMNRVN